MRDDKNQWDDLIFIRGERVPACTPINEKNNVKLRKYPFLRIFLDRVQLFLSSRHGLMLSS